MHLITVTTVILVTILCCIQHSSADPIFAKLFGFNSYGGYQGGGYGGGGYGTGYRSFGAPAPRRQPSSRSDGARSYKQVCRTIHADSYANPRAIPFPAQPFCPY